MKIKEIIKKIDESGIDSKHDFLSSLIFVIYYLILVTINDDFFDIIKIPVKNAFSIIFLSMLVVSMLIEFMSFIKKKLSLKIILYLDFIILFVISYIILF
jgi:predicted Na+-dependent transporter